MSKKIHIHWDGQKKTHCGVYIQRHLFLSDKHGATCKNCIDLYERRIESKVNEKDGFIKASDHTLKYRVVGISKSGQNINVIITVPRYKGKTIMQSLAYEFEKKTGLRSKDFDKLWTGAYTNTMPEEFKQYTN